MRKIVSTLLLIVLLFSINVHAEPHKNIEIFDINKEKVVKVVQSNPIIQSIVLNYLQEITGIYAKFDPIPNKGFGIKIPVEPSVRIKNQWLTADVKEVIILFPQEEGPASFLLVFENENKLVCFTFKGNTDLLLKHLDFSPP